MTCAWVARLFLDFETTPDKSAHDYESLGVVQVRPTFPARRGYDRGACKGHAWGVVFENRRLHNAGRCCRRHRLSITDPAAKKRFFGGHIWTTGQYGVSLKTTNSEQQNSQGMAVS
eukprot:4393644-Alexandrium_andersonii.AAC.1